MLWMNPHRRTRGRLSAYIDRQLSPGEARAVEAHLSSCEECRAGADDLRAAVRALQMLPQAEPPRSFALTPEMASRPARSAPARPMAPMQAGLRLAAAGLAVALAVVFTVDVSNVAQNGGEGDRRQAPGAYLMTDGLPPTFAPAPGAAGPSSGDDLMRDADAVPAGGAAPTGDAQSSAGIGVDPLAPAAGQSAPSPSSGEPATGVSGGAGLAPGTGAPPSAVETPSPESAATLGGVASQGDSTPEVTEVPKANHDPGVYGAEEGSGSGGETDLVQPAEGTDTLRIVEAALVVALALAVGGSVVLALAARRR